MRKFSLKQIGLWVVLLAVTLSGSQCGKPTEPQPLITKTDYPVYFRKDEDAYGTSTYLYRYRPTTNEVDSILMPDTFNFFEVKPGEKQIFLHSNGKTEVYDIETQQIISVLPYFGRMSCSPDSQLIAISDGTELNIIDADNYSLIYHDTTDVARAVFTRDNKKLFCFNSTTPNLIILDRENNFSKTEKQIDVLAGRPIPSYDGQKLFFLNYFNWDATAFEVYDFSVDSIIFINVHSPGHGLMTISPDGKFVFFTNPGTMMVGTFPPPYYNAYDVDKNELLEISTLNFPGTENDSIKGMIAQEVAVTSDGKWVTTVGLGGYITAAEIETMTIVKSRMVERRADLWWWWNLTSSVLPPQL
ncbi:MAG TPA: hypothetical protein ENH23_03685 [candidate division Zixibacteria bacterium]|nr:hypothetical protein [candidate division Zixibacteria bacterium]